VTQLISGRLSFVLILGFIFFFPHETCSAVVPVGQLPAVTVSLPPSIYALPVLVVEDRGEWKDFGIQIRIQVHENGLQQIKKLSANEWEVAVMDPFYAIQGGNEGEVAVVGAAGNFSSQIHLVSAKGKRPPPISDLSEWIQGKRVICLDPSIEHFFLTSLLARQSRKAIFTPIAVKDKDGGEKAFLRGEGDLWVTTSPKALDLIQKKPRTRIELRKETIFIPATLVAASLYADTRKTLVIRWLEGYGRGLRIIQSDPPQAAARLKRFWKETLNVEIPMAILLPEIQKAFIFGERERAEFLRSQEGKNSALEEFAKSMSLYQSHWKAIETKAETSEYILPKICEELFALHGEAEAQLEKTQTAIQQARDAGASVKSLERTWQEAQVQIQEGRGCLAVIGTLSDLQRSADQARVTSRMLWDFRRIEMTIGGILFLYYTGYAVRRRRRYSAGVSKGERNG
jgi:ABC-type nitrate/sulfonate/bicarbonate transport system substrate-binding protein